MASLSATVLFEFARWAFNWYVVFAHETLTLYGVLDGLMFFFFWLYYASLVFVLGAEMGFAMNKPVCRGVKPSWTPQSTEELFIERRFIEI